MDGGGVSLFLSSYRTLEGRGERVVRTSRHNRRFGVGEKPTFCLLPNRRSGRDDLSERLWRTGWVPSML